MEKRLKLALVATNLLFLISLNSALADLRRTPDTRKSCVLDPFNYEFKRSTYYDLHIRSIIRNLQRAGFIVDYYKDNNVTIDLLKRLDNEEYGVIYINTHGFVDSEGTVLIFTGENHTLGKEELYWKDIEEDRIRWFESQGNVMGYYYVTPSFFTLYGNDTGYHNALVFVDACHSANNTSMAEAFLDLGAGCYAGWTALVGVEYGVAMDGKFFKQICIDGETVEESIGKIKPDPKSKSRMTYFGDSGLTLAETRYQPESQDLSAWIPITMLLIVLMITTGIYMYVCRE